MTTRTVTLTVAVGALTVYDAATTAVALSAAGGTELNPLVAAAIGTVGLAGAMVLRIALGIVLVAVMARMTMHPSNRLGHLPLLLAGAALGAVAVWNTWMLVARGPWGVLA